MSFPAGKHKACYGEKNSEKDAGVIHHYSLLPVFDFIPQFQKFGKQLHCRNGQNKPNDSSYLIPNLKYQNSVFEKHPA